MLVSTRLRRYLQSLHVPSGPLAGTNLRVFPWQNRLLRLMDSEGDVPLSVARGCGKSCFTAGIAAAHVDPLSGLQVPGADVVITAAAHRQARICFGDALNFLREKHDLADKSVWRVNDSAQHSEIRHLPSGSRLVAIGSDPRRAHGLRPILMLWDEPAQAEPSKRDRMQSALLTSKGKVAGSRIIWLGTRSADPDHFFESELRGPRAILYWAPPEMDPYRAPAWHSANPSLKWMPELRKAIAAEAREAREDPAKQPRFEALRLNRGVSDAPEERLIPAGTWESIEGTVTRSGPLVLGVDLGTNEAMSAVAAYWPETGALAALAAFPEIPSLRKRGVKDGVGDRYLRMHRREELIVAGRRVSDISILMTSAVTRYGTPELIVCDAWRLAQLKEVLEQIGFPLTSIVTRRMGPKDGGADIRRFRRTCLSGHVRPETSLLLRSAISEARARLDIAGNMMLDKSRHRAKDDAAAAAILAVAEGDRRRNQPRRRLRYVVA